MRPHRADQAPCAVTHQHDIRESLSANTGNRCIDFLVVLGEVSREPGFLSRPKRPAIATQVERIPGPTLFGEVPGDVILEEVIDIPVDIEHGTPWWHRRA